MVCTRIKIGTYVDEGSHPCRHGSGCKCEFSHRSQSRVPLVSELRRSFSAGLDKCDKFYLVAFSCLLFRFRESRGFGREVVYDSGEFVQEGFA